MPLTAPTTVTYRLASFGLIDQSGDQRSVSLKLGAAVTSAEVLDIGAALGAASKANLYKIEVSDVYADAPDASEALDGERDSVYDNVVILFKSIATFATQNAFIPAPVDAIMLGESDDPDTSAALYTAYRDAIDTALGAGWDPISARFTERREINDRRFPA